MAIGVIGNDNKNHLLNNDMTNKYYDNSFHIDLNDLNESHSIIANNIADNSLVLDIGCSQGLLGEVLKKEKKCKVYGIELDKDAIKIAKKQNYYEEIYNFNITDKNNKNYKNFFNKKFKFDYIVFSDVLEHLINPSEILFEFGKILKDNGNILISLPNIAHYDIINGLLNEKFNYSKMGILDNTHLRFFTRYSFAEYIKESNENNDYVFDMNVIGRTIIYPEFYYKYKYLSKLINNNENLYALQNLFCLTKKKKNSKTENLDKIILNNSINITKLIDNKLELASKVEQKELEILDLKSKINELENEKNYINELYLSVIKTKSWKFTKIFRGLDYINDIVINSIKENNKKKNVLIFIQSWVDLKDTSKKNIGGTTLHVLDLIDNLHDRINFFVITVINNKYVLIVFKNHMQYIYDLGIKVYVYRFDGYHYEFLEKMLEIIEKFDIDLIHIHHIINFPCDLQYIAKKRETFLSLHDYTTICPNYFLINQNKKYCKNARSDECFKCSKNIDLKTRNTAIDNLYNNVKKVIVPDESVIHEIKKYCKINEYITIPNGVNIEKFTKFNVNRDSNKKKKLAFVGIVNDHKGSEIYKQLILNDKNYDYYLFGDSNDEFFKKNLNNYKYCGFYDNKDLPKLLNDNKIDLVLMLSVCPESFSYTLSETMIAKVPVLTFDIGAIANRVKKYGVGKVIPYNSNYESIIKEIDILFKNNVIKEYKKRLEEVKVPSVDEMCSEIFKLYSNIEKKSKKSYLSKKMYLDKYNLVKKI